VNRSLSERTNHRRKNSIVFSAENPANFQIPSVFTIEKNLRVLFLCFFSKPFPEHMETQEKPSKTVFFFFHKIITKIKNSGQKDRCF